MSLRDQVLHSLKWLAAARMLGQVVTWSVTLLVIRLLEPSDYGLMALANILIGFANLFTEMGLYAAMVQKKGLTDRQIEQAFGFLLIVNCLIYVVLAFSAPLIATFFSDERLVPIIRVLALQFPLMAVGVVQNAMLSRRMAFKRISFVNFVVMLSNAAVTLALALAGEGVWALVLGSLTAATARPVGMVLAARHWCRPRFSRRDIRAMTRFGGFVTTSRLLWYCYQESDTIIIGKVLGNEILGQYAVAVQLASLPLKKFAGFMNDVGLAAYSRVQDDSSAIRFYYCKGLRMAAFFSFPVFWGISSISPELVRVVLGDTWTPAILPLAILSLIMPIRMISTAGGAVFEAIGRPQVGTVNILITFLVMPPAFLLGVHWGLLGVSLAWLIAFPAVSLIRLHRSLPVIGLNVREYFVAISGPAIGGLIMYGTVSAARIAIAQPYMPPAAGMIFLIVVGAASYSLYMWFRCQLECREVMDLFGGGRAASAS